MKTKNNLGAHLGFFAFLTLFFCAVSWLIVTQHAPFFDWDESIYAQVGREMMRQKSFLVPLWQGQPWLDKPPIPSLFYGIVQLLPIAPEISTRIATLFLSCIALSFLYLLGLKTTKSRFISLLSVVITAFLPIYFQRSQALNVDVFLLVGWLGYVLWYENTLLSTFFLILAVLSKSLLGFFPPFLFLAFHTWEFLRKTIDKKTFILYIRKVSLQLFVSSLWFVGMILVYRYAFIQCHFIDSHLKRVTASIEQHFGQRTFYVTVLIDQFKLLLIPAFISGYLLMVSFFKKPLKQKTILLAAFFVPWFIFLNLTKTKIEWYIYPVLPQFSLLSVYCLTLLKKKPLYVYVGGIALLVLYFFTITPISLLFTKPFSNLEDHQQIAMQAKKHNCPRLFVLVNTETRSSFATLRSMDLVITTTTWWGNHPSMAYYADTKIKYIYDVTQWNSLTNHAQKKECFIMEGRDRQYTYNSSSLHKIETNKTFELFQKE